MHRTHEVPSAEADLVARHHRLVAATSAIEAPRLLFLVLALILGFDLLYAALGMVAPTGYYLVDVAQAAILIGGAVGLRSGRIPAEWAPAVCAGAVVANALATNVQFLIVGQGALAVVSFMLAVASSTALRWRPFIIGAALSVLITAAVRGAAGHESWPVWAIAEATGFAVGAMLVYGRRASLRALAVAEERIEALAIVDQLTDLLNRRGLRRLAEPMFARARRGNEPAFAMFLDVAGLKQVNKAFGHGEGDAVLVAVAHVLHEASRAGDLVCRWGGDEFVLLGIGSAPERDEFVARVLDQLEQQHGSRVWRPALWAGLATASHAHDFDGLIDAADQDMRERRSATLDGQSNTYG